MSEASKPTSRPIKLDAAWAAYLCSLHGHIQLGSGFDTNPANTVWSGYCARCGASLR